MYLNLPPITWKACAVEALGASERLVGLRGADDHLYHLLVLALGRG